jgi:hypothetical protein
MIKNHIGPTGEEVIESDKGTFVEHQMTEPKQMTADDLIDGFGSFK